VTSGGRSVLVIVSTPLLHSVCLLLGLPEWGQGLPRGTSQTGRRCTTQPKHQDHITLASPGDEVQHSGNRKNARDNHHPNNTVRTILLGNRCFSARAEGMERSASSMFLVTILLFLYDAGFQIGKPNDCPTLMSDRRALSVIGSSSCERTDRTSSSSSSNPSRSAET
jgi:hypothetical protein